MVSGNTEQFFNYFPVMDKIIYYWYLQADIDNFTEMMPKAINNLFINVTNRVGIAKIFKIYFSTIDDNNIQWEKCSSDNTCNIATQRENPGSINNNNTTEDKEDKVEQNDEIKDDNGDVNSDDNKIYNNIKNCHDSLGVFPNIIITKGVFWWSRFSS